MSPWHRRSATQSLRDASRRPNLVFLPLNERLLLGHCRSFCFALHHCCEHFRGTPSFNAAAFIVELSASLIAANLNAAVYDRRVCCFHFDAIEVFLHFENTLYGLKCRRKNTNDLYAGRFFYEQRKQATPVYKRRINVEAIV